MSHVERTCTEVPPSGDDQRAQTTSRPLKEYRDLPAYVLLGDAGAGKTTAFATECNALGDEAILLTARDFNTYDPGDRPDWHHKTVFIDGLDEVRAGSADARTPFDEIRRRLDRLGRPHFRLSCRAADWLGEHDRNHLTSVAPGGARATVLRLDPLNASDAAQILSDHTSIPNVRGFIRAAVERGMEGLLWSPQNLILLAQVVSETGSWPETRSALLEMACELMTGERNDEHRRAAPQPPELFDAAGRLCAVLLISGAAGYTLDGDRSDGDYLQLDDCEYERHQFLHPALATNVFTEAATGRVPVHRRIAEFVAAKHLARLIDNGLPARRVIALITGEDGMAATSLRGLSAWLATLCGGVRSEILERDPVGVATYGDIQRFAGDEKKALLNALSREADHLGSIDWTASTAGALATPDMEPALRSVLEARLDVPATVLALVLSALKCGTPIPGIADLLFEIACVRNPWPDHSTLALEAFIHNSVDGQIVISKLRQLLSDISANKLQDSEGQLTSIAFRHLYPERISPSSIWDHLAAIDQRGPPYNYFWKSLLIVRSTDTRVMELLDDLVTKGPDLQHILAARRLEDVPSELLARGIEAWGDKIDTNRLVDWLLACRVPRYRTPPHEASRRIRTWLQQRPDVQRSVVEECVNRCHASLVNLGIDEFLHGSPLPPDFGEWCLEHAEHATERSAAEFYLREACARDVSIEVLWDRTRNNTLLRDLLNQVVVCDLPPGYFDGRRDRSSYLEESETRREELVALVRSNIDALHDNRCDVRLLHELGQAYYGTVSDIEGDDPMARLHDLLDGNTALIDAVLAGFRGTPFREDIPEFHGVLRLLKSGQEYLVALPYLAGIDELGDLNRLTEHQLRQALAFHFCTSVNDPHNRELRLLIADSEIGAEMLVKCVRAKMRNGTYDYVAARLAADDLRPVARRAALSLLRAVPLRSTLRMAMTTLDHLFIAAFRFSDRAELLALIADKLSRRSMSATQRVHWLAAEVVGASETCLDRLQAFVQGHEGRAAQLVGFLFGSGSLLDALPARTLGCFITLVAPLTRVLERTMTPVGETEYKATRSAEQMIWALAERPGRDADEQLERLATNPVAAECRGTVTAALDRHRTIRRDAAYRHPTAGQVCRTLRGGPPANVGDLAALAVDTLQELALRIRTANTDDWRQYWNEPRGQEPTPKHEDQCRDALLSDLRHCLPDGVDAQPEWQYANDKRSDIRVIYDGFGIPVEIKKNPHRNLWSAVRNQLIAQYASDPATEGYGIYLVFWFGSGDKQPPPPSGPPPADADDLRMRLEETLSDAERRKISVVVIDVSRPTRTGLGRGRDRG